MVMKNMITNINIPRSGSFANAWTEFSIPDLTKKFPINS